MSATHILDGVRAVFFDAVGTLLFPEPNPLVAYAEAAARQGFAIAHDELRRRFVTAYHAEESADRAADWVTSEVRESERWQRIVHASLAGVPDPDACFRELFDHFAQPEAWRVPAECAALFADLRERSIVLGIGSNYDLRLLSVLAGHVVLHPLRERTVISAAVGYRKPAVEFFREVIRVAGCSTSEVLFVGDDVENDYRGAVNAGLRAVLLADRAVADVSVRIASFAELI